jgi:hypothetical protein
MNYLAGMKYAYFLRLLGGLLLAFGVCLSVLAVIGDADSGGFAGNLKILYFNGPTAPLPFACCILGGVYLMARK